MKRTWILTTLCVSLALALSGCSSNADTQPSPTAGAPSVSPGMPTNQPGATGEGLLGLGEKLTENGGQITTAEEALSASAALRDAVEKLTEVETAVAVACGDTALVGVTYPASYQGGLDDRLRGMILDRAQTVHPALQTVAVTDDPAKINEIAALYQMLQSGSPYPTVKANADTLADGLDVYKK